MIVSLHLKLGSVGKKAKIVRNFFTNFLLHNLNVKWLLKIKHFVFVIRSLNVY